MPLWFWIRDEERRILASRFRFVCMKDVIKCFECYDWRVRHGSKYRAIIYGHN